MMGVPCAERIWDKTPRKRRRLLGGEGTEWNLLGVGVWGERQRACGIHVTGKTFHTWHIVSLRSLEQITAMQWKVLPAEKRESGPSRVFQCFSHNRKGD